MVRLSELSDGMELRAIGDWADCWKDGEKLTVHVYRDGQGPFVHCHASEDEEDGDLHAVGQRHYLDGMIDDQTKDDELDMFEVIK